MVLGKGNKLSEPPIIPLGAEGKLKGHTFKVVACLEKKEEGKNYSWKEYRLYNFEKGYAVLSVYDGHWNLVMGVEFHPELKRLRSQSRKYLTFRKEKYSLYNRYTSETTSLIGEFNWDALKSNITISEYVAPPFMVFCEKNEENETEYFLGSYIEPAEIAEAFKVGLYLFPSKKGVGANQVSKFAGPMKETWNITRYLIIAIVVIQGLIMIIKPESEAISLSHEVTPNTESSFKTSSFTVFDRSSAIEIEIYSDINNNWMEATSVLVNEKTNQTWEVNQGIEHYSGYEGGESWSEGSKKASILLSSIPAGNYHLNVYPATGDLFPQTINVSVTLNATLWRNLICTILLICLYPFFTIYKVRSFERQRWSNSDFSPYWE